MQVLFLKNWNIEILSYFIKFSIEYMKNDASSSKFIHKF